MGSLTQATVLVALATAALRVPGPRGLVLRGSFPPIMEMDGSMFIRVDNGDVPPERLDDFIAFVRDTVLPEVRRRNGYRWLTVSIDRTAGAVSVTTAWDSYDERAEANSAFKVVLERGPEYGLRPVRMDFTEQVLSDVNR